MFDSWGKWFRVMITLTMAGAAVWYLPQIVDAVVKKAAEYYHMFK
jgi:hypothetical protein